MKEPSMNAYEGRLNQEALEKKREEYIMAEIKELYRTSNSAMAMLTGSNDITVEIVVGLLKEKHGISRASSAEDKAQFEKEYPQDVINDAYGKFLEEWEKTNFATEE